MAERKGLLDLRERKDLPGLRVMMGLQGLKVRQEQLVLQGRRDLKERKAYKALLDLAEA
jgi:hypothetical protein